MRFVLPCAFHRNPFFCILLSLSQRPVPFSPFPLFIAVSLFLGFSVSQFLCNFFF